MFAELLPLIKQRRLLIIVEQAAEGDLIAVNVIPKPIKDGEDPALSTPLSPTMLKGTAEELDASMPEALRSFVAHNLSLAEQIAAAEAERKAETQKAEAERKADQAKRTAAKSPAKPAEKKAEIAPVAATAPKFSEPSLFELSGIETTLAAGPTPASVETPAAVGEAVSAAA